MWHGRQIESLSCHEYNKWASCSVTCLFADRVLCRYIVDSVGGAINLIYAQEPAMIKANIFTSSEMCC